RKAVDAQDAPSGGLGAQLRRVEPAARARGATTAKDRARLGSSAVSADGARCRLSLRRPRRTQLAAFTASLCARPEASRALYADRPSVGCMGEAPNHPAAA